jgi:hypothetical protein
LDNFYHVGIVVADLREGMEDLGQLLNLSWAPVVEGTKIELQTPSGLIDPELRFTMSQQGAPYLELIESAPDTPWSDAGINHLGFWSEDLVGDSHAYAKGGKPLVATYPSADGNPAGFAYHHTLQGLLIELVDVAQKEAMMAWIAGATFDTD